MKFWKGWLSKRAEPLQQPAEEPVAEPGAERRERVDGIARYEC
jgi:hypothetical protein